MNDINYYEKLKADFPTFGSTLTLDSRQQKSLKSLLAYSHGALNSYRNEFARLRNPNIDLSEEHKKEKLTEVKAKCTGAIITEFNHIQKRVETAETVLHSATHETAPKDPTEALLRFMQQKEIRDALVVMPLAQRVGVLMTTVQEGNGAVLHAVENQPVTSGLVPPADMERFYEVYSDRVAPEQSMLLDGAKMDLDGALGVKNLAEVEMGRIENG